MTEKLYYSDCYISEFDAVVLGAEAINDKVALILDRTAFFPEGGGQPCDTGYIGCYFVYDVREVDGKILHFINGNSVPEIDATLSCAVNWKKRFVRMQSHSGEHIISGVAHSLFGAENVGFHMDDTVMTVDFNKPLTKEQISLIEEKANDCVFSNVSINTFICTSQEAAKYNYRSKLEFTDDVRLVEIEGIDLCACCAPHVTKTGEIGIIKILSAVSHRGGVRITLICGKTAYDDYCMKHNNTMNISSMLCAKHNETDIAVKKLTQSNAELKFSFSNRQKALLEIIADKIEENDIIVEFFDTLLMEDIREICNFTCKKCKTLCMILTGDDLIGYSYCVYSELPMLSEIIRDFNNALSGRGGGRGNMLQGKVKASENEIRKFFNELKV